MNGLRKKVMLSAVVLVFAFVATIGSTYAWFTVSNIVEVTSFDINVESAQALLVKVWDGETLVDDQAYGSYSTADDGVNFWTLDDFSNSVNILDSAIYNTSGAQDIGAALLSPVTGAAGEAVAGGTDYDEFHVATLRKPSATFLTGVAASGRTYDSASPNISGGGYIQIQLWVLKPAGTNEKVTFDYSITDGSSETYEQSIFFGTYERNAANTVTNELVFGSQLDLDFNWANATVPGFDTTGGSLFNDIVGTDAASALTGITGTINDTGVMTLDTANVPELLTINIWAEGWDEDCVNAIMGAQFSITFTLTLVA